MESKMIRNIQRRYFEVWGNEEAQNVFLKGVLIALSSLFLIQSVAITILALRKPVLIGVSQTETKLFTITPPPVELLNSELSRFVKNYIQDHYNWDPATIEKAHENASKYVSEKFKKIFFAANEAQVKIAKEKKISQRVYLAHDPVIDTKTLTGRIQMDRILMVENLRAVSSVTLDITFEYGPRTEKNPEGIYVTGEKVLTQ